MELTGDHTMEGGNGSEESSGLSYGRWKIVDGADVACVKVLWNCFEAVCKKNLRLLLLLLPTATCAYISRLLFIDQSHLVLPVLLLWFGSTKGRGMRCGRGKGAHWWYG